ncbi:MAG: hypothetical protein ACK4QW_17215 [Alphaproteobacteria bacterium]
MEHAAADGMARDFLGYGGDLPYIVPVLGRAHVVLPYSFDTNDMRFTAQGGSSTPAASPTAASTPWTGCGARRPGGRA